MGKFGWSYPAGCSDSDIDYYFGCEDEEGDEMPRMPYDAYPDDELANNIHLTDSQLDRIAEMVIGKVEESAEKDNIVPMLKTSKSEDLLLILSTKIGLQHMLFERVVKFMDNSPVAAIDALGQIADIEWKINIACRDLNAELKEVMNPTKRDSEGTEVAGTND